MLLFGDYRQRIPVRMYTDSEPSLEIIASTKQIERKSLRMTVQEMKERWIEGDVISYQWIPIKEMWSIKFERGALWKKIIFFSTEEY